MFKYRSLTENVGETKLATKLAAKVDTQKTEKSDDKLLLLQREDQQSER